MEKKRYIATDPNGDRHTIWTKLHVEVAAMLKLPNGAYHAKFSKSQASAQSAYGAKAVIVKATAL
jgi:hypothetical protein